MTSYAFPLSHAQTRLWFLEKSGAGSAAWNICSVARMHAAINERILRRACKLLMERHEILRTRIAEVKGEPKQVVVPAPAVPLAEYDLRAEPPAQRERLARELVHEEANRLFALDAAPLWRVVLIHHSESEALIVVILHHIIADGWSMTVFWTELEELYDSIVSQRRAVLPELHIQFADYAIWEHENASNHFSESSEYWRAKLAGARALSLPPDHRRPSAPSERAGSRSLTINPDLTERLTALAQEHRATLFMVLLAAFDVLLFRYSGQNDVVVGTPVARRDRVETEHVIGPFVNPLPVRVILDPEADFTDALGRVTRAVLEVQAHQSTPFEALVEMLQPRREFGVHPIYQVSFQLFQRPKLRSDAAAEVILPPRTATILDLGLDLWATGEEIIGRLEYGRDLFEDVTLERFAANYLTLLESVARQPQLAISELPIISRAEHGLIIDEWNRTEHAYTESASVSELFERQVARTPDAIAVEHAGGALSYRELNARANQLARHLIARGLGNGLVALRMGRSQHLVMSILAVLKCGAAYLPIDSHWPLQRVGQVLANAKPANILVDDENADELGLFSELSSVTSVTRQAELWGEECTADLSASARHDELAYVIYTSGSTGEPKGVAVPMRGLVNYLSWCLDAYPTAPGSRVPLFTPVSFDLTVTSLFPTLLSGATLWVLPNAETVPPFRPGLGLVKLTPAHLDMAAVEVGVGRSADWSNTLVVGGAALHPSSARFWLKHAPRTRLVNEYGPTETTVGSVVHQVSLADTDETSIAIGRPIFNTRVYVLDEKRAPVPVGAAGELYIGGHGVARGYLNRPELTRESFLDSPFVPGDRLYRTGDRCRYRFDGRLEYLGRSDAQIKLHGYRVELGEVEACLRAHPDVCEGVVQLRAQPNGDERLAAYVVLKREAGIEPVRAHLESNLPSYMVPACWTRIDEMPLNSNGKVDMTRLPEPTVSETARQTFAAARDPMEARLLSWYEELLGQAPIGIDDDFFVQLGGHSLLAARLAGRIQASFDIQFSVRSIFKAPTVRQLGAEVVAACAARQGTTDIEALFTRARNEHSTATRGIDVASPLEINTSSETSSAWTT